jgi:hypothetical protein
MLLRAARASTPGSFGPKIFTRADRAVPARRTRQAPRLAHLAEGDSPGGQAPGAGCARAAPRSLTCRALGDGVEERVTVTPPQTPVRLGELPAVPVRLVVVAREEVVAQAPGDEGQPAEHTRDGQAPSRWMVRRPRGVVIGGDVDNVDNVTCPSCSVLSAGGVWLGRCCSTDPAVCPGYSAAGDGGDPGSLRLSPRMLSPGLYASAQGKRMRPSRAVGNGSASSHARGQVLAGRRRSLRAGHWRHAICRR